MHVLQALGFPPDRIGGTEIYVADLARHLSGEGFTSVFVAPYEGDGPRLAEYAGFRVESYPVNAVPSTGELRGGDPHQGFDEFRSILARYPGAIYHQHSWTRGCGSHHLHAARIIGMATILTMHVPGNLCMRGDLMRFGQEACDGHIDIQTCAACWLQSKGLPKMAASAVSRMPLPLSRAIQKAPGTLATMLSAPAQAEEKKRSASQMFKDCDHMVALSSWGVDALLENGALRKDILLSRQGVSEDFFAGAPRPRSPAGKGVELLYLGSWNPLKGIDVAVQAVMALPAEEVVRLTICAPSGGAEERAYERQVREMVAEDSRIVFSGPVSHGALVQVMAGYDALVVPSLCLETGPMVVMEAQAAGLFVIGSNLGGIAENVREGAGILVEPRNIPAWAAAIRAIAMRRRAGRLETPRNPSRTMAMAAADMAALYRTLQA